MGSSLTWMTTSKFEHDVIPNSGYVETDVKLSKKRDILNLEIKIEA